MPSRMQAPLLPLRGDAQCHYRSIGPDTSSARTWKDLVAVAAVTVGLLGLAGAAAPALGAAPAVQTFSAAALPSTATARALPLRHAAPGFGGGPARRPVPAAAAAAAPAAPVGAASAAAPAARSWVHTALGLPLAAAMAVGAVLLWGSSRAPRQSRVAAADLTHGAVPAPLMAMAATTGVVAEEAEAEESLQDKAFQSAFLKTMAERGFLHQCTNADALDEQMCKGPVVAYLGFDATADSLHVGSLLQIMILRHLQQSGHKPIVLIGGGTSKVGDPSGKDASRQMMTEETIRKNMDGISQVFKKFLTFGDGPTDAVMVNNDDWLGSLQYLEFLRDYGRLFTINRMLTFESVKQRLERESPLTFLEFNYMLLQAYDFVELNRRYGATVQMGGSDQWGNIINGIELGRRLGQPDLFGVTAPLITTSDGRKMGKSASGAVWLNADKLAPFDYWQFWRNTTDADVIRFLKLFTELDLARIEELSALQGADINKAKKILADETTRMLHGAECLQQIHEAAQAQFAGGKGATDALPKVVVDEGKVAAGMKVVQLYVDCGFCKSQSEARRLIQGGGARLNDEQIKDVNLLVTPEVFGEGAVKLSSGKKKHVMVEMGAAAVAMAATTGQKEAPVEDAVAAAPAADKFYVTTPIYYVNDVPHIGHAYTTIACDCLARFNRLDGVDQVHFLTGTDEHGQKVQESSEKFGMAPGEYVGMRAKRFEELAEALGASHDDFIRTTQARHARAATKLWNVLMDKGEIYLGQYEGWYSVRDEAFYSAKEIVDGKAPTGAPVEWVVEPSYFFRLSAWQDKLLAWYDAHADCVLPISRRNEVLGFLRENDLMDLSVSRTSFDWGIPVPNDPKHVMYVWLDALANYLTAAGYGQGAAVDGPETFADAEGFGARWPAQLHVVGKDILRFHAIYWPCMLMAAGLEPPKRVFAHGWWTKDGQKISKSLGNVIDPFELLETYGVDATRYFLMAEVGFGADGDFSHDRLTVRVNTQLCNGLGNLCNRVLSICFKNCDKAVPVLDDAAEYTAADEELLALAGGLLGRMRAHMDVQALNKAADEIFAVCDAANKYVEEMAPWGLKKTDPARMRVVLYVSLEVVRHLAICLTPFTPGLSGRILDAVGVPPEPEARSFAALTPGAPPLQQGTPIPKPQPLVPRIEQQTE